MDDGTLMDVIFGSDREPLRTGTPICTHENWLPFSAGCRVQTAVSKPILRIPAVNKRPTPAHYAAFVFIVCLSVAVTTIAARALTAVLERIYITIISLLKSISLRNLNRE